VGKQKKDMAKENAPETTSPELEKIAALEAEKAELAAIVADMQEQLNAVGATKGAKAVVVKVDKTQYEVTSGVNIPGLGTFTKEELAKNKEAVAELLAIEGQTILKAL
jgi:hypothetical protein